jgi:hypothetical protein
LLRAIADPSKKQCVPSLFSQKIPADARAKSGDTLLAHLSPLGWEHVNLTGDYVWAAEQDVSENLDGLRPLRAPSEDLLNAA